jgi:hypothetical protein
MKPIIAVLGEDTVTLKPDFIYEFMGRGYIYIYQTIGEGQATVEVSNDKTTWVELVLFENNDYAVVAHTWAYQRLKPTTLTITVRRD